MKLVAIWREKYKLFSDCKSVTYYWDYKHKKMCSISILENIYLKKLWTQEVLSLATSPICYILVQLLNTLMNSHSTIHGSNEKIFSKHYTSLSLGYKIPWTYLLHAQQNIIHISYSVFVTIYHLKASSCHTQNSTQFEQFTSAISRNWKLKRNKPYQIFSRLINLKWKVKYPNIQQQKCVIPKTITD
jgi:hypothetical protein